MEALAARAAAPVLRRQAQQALHERGLRAVLMEDEPTQPHQEQDLSAKFHRLLDTVAMAAVVVVWPAGAKMAAMWDELLYLVERQRECAVPPVWVLHHHRAARIARGRFEILQRGDRSCYLRGVHLLPLRPLPWRGRADFLDAVGTVADETVPRVALARRTAAPS